MRYKNRKKNRFIMMLIALIGCIGLGYAFLTQELTINGIGKVDIMRWNVYFDNLILNPNNVSLSSEDVMATIDPTTKTSIDYTVTLQKPGDFYEFTVDVVNAGNIDAMIATVIQQYNGEDISDENPLPDYVRYTVTYEDGIEILKNHLLGGGGVETYKVRLEYRKDIDSSNLPDVNTSFTFRFGVEYVQADRNAIIRNTFKLYNVMAGYAFEGKYARAYTGEHQDSFDASQSTKRIYHWYANNNKDGEAIRDKNNVLFADMCWNIVRTTDTGGVKLVYNGEAENNQCLDTRGTHIGYNNNSSVYLYSSAGGFYYGTDYTYDSSSKLFSLSGTLQKRAWSEANAPDLIGKYTCKSANETDTCSELYYIVSYRDSSYANSLLINSNSHYSQFGTLPFNNQTSYNESSPAEAGYMYNELYLVKLNYSLKSFSVSYTNIGTTGYYSDTFDWNTTTSNQYTLINPQPLSTLTDYTSLVGKYVITNNTTHSSSIYYIMKVDGTRAYYYSLSNGDTITSITLGDSYEESGGIYTLTGNVTNVSYKDWYFNISDLNIYKGKYFCDGNNVSCTNIKRLPHSDDSPFNNSHYYYYDSNNNWSYAEDVIYDGNTYTLTGDIKTFWDYSIPENYSAMDNHHYTCLNEGTSCERISYITGKRDYLLDIVQFSGFENAQEALDKMLIDSNVNRKDSTIKTGIDAWYKKYMLPYDNYLEDTIFCNNRTITEYGSWNPSVQNNTSSSNDVIFEDPPSNRLSCNRVTDQFSTVNPAATLTYKTGLLTVSEVQLFNNINIQKTGKQFWLVTPKKFSSFGSAYIYLVYESGTISSTSSGGYEGVRPSISLKPGTIYTLGDGSMANPYKIDFFQISIDSNLFTVPSIENVGKNVTIYSDDYFVKSFKLNGTLVYGDSFIMPSEDVTITDIEYIQATYSITNTDSSINVPAKGRYGSTITLTSDNYRVISFKLNGTLVNGNSFVMPAEDVAITEVEKNTQIIIESEHNPYANNLNNVVYYENTFSGASSITVELTYQTESTSFDWIYLYDNPNSSTPYLNKMYGNSTLTTETINLNSNYIKIVFNTDSSVNNYYGFKAVIIPNNS